MIPELQIKNIEDPYVREAFVRITTWMKQQNALKPDWNFYEIDLPAGNSTFPHRLNYRPTDYFITSVSNQESVIINYEDCTTTHFDFTASGECTVRLFAGRYHE